MIKSNYILVSYLQKAQYKHKSWNSITKLTYMHVIFLFPFILFISEQYTSSALVAY